MQQWFAEAGAAQRVDAFSLEASGLYLDYSKNRITGETLALLMKLAEEAGVPARRDAMFAGEHINATEDRAALHVALRALPDAPFKVDGASVMPAIHDVLRRMREFAGRVRSGVWTGSTGQGITDIVNVGIGGSDLGHAWYAAPWRTWPTRADRVCTSFRMWMAPSLPKRSSAWIRHARW